MDKSRITTLRGTATRSEGKRCAEKEEEESIPFQARTTRRTSHLTTPHHCLGVLVSLEDLLEPCFVVRERFTHQREDFVVAKQGEGHPPLVQSLHSGAV